jgi:lipopolysaccharide assembly outer membrane protein LptD (OstA)
MKCLILAGLLAAITAIAQQDVRINGHEVVRDGPVTKARGSATLSNPSVRIQADSITYNRETGEAVATGNVHIKFVTKAESSDSLAPANRPTFEQRMNQMRRGFPPDIYVTK